MPHTLEYQQERIKEQKENTPAPYIPEMMSYILHLEKRVKELEERLSKYEEPGKDVAEVQ